MGYKVLGRTEDVYGGYKPIRGLEGPFAFVGGRVLYYDPKAGQNWDPKTDFYVEQSEMNQIHAELTRILAQ